MSQEKLEVLESRGWAIPEFEVLREKAVSNRHALCVFVLNEGKKIQKQLREMQPLSSCVDIIIADGGSTDGAFTEEVLGQGNVSALLVKRGPGKLSAQMRMGLGYAMRRGYEGVVVIDGNGKDGHDAVPRFVEKLKEGFDHVQGSRFIPGGHHENTPLSRFLAVKLLHAPMISLAAGMRCTDTTNGFRAYSRKLLLDSRVLPFREVFQAYELHYYLAVRAARLGFNCVEIPVSRVYPATGKVPTKISPIRGNWNVLKTLWKACRRQFDP